MSQCDSLADRLNFMPLDADAQAATRDSRHSARPGARAAGLGFTHAAFRNLPGCDPRKVSPHADRQAARSL